MTRTEFTFKTKDNTEIFVFKWTPSKDAVAVIQIAHGMAEHAERYQHFAEFLTEKGFIVYANDHRGHKNTAGGIENLGFFAPKNGWHKVTDDLKQLSDIITKDHPTLPFFMLGHSMGSLLIRTCIAKHNNKNIKGVVLSGTSGESGPILKIGKFLAKVLGLINGKETPSKMLDNISFGKFNDSFKPERTRFDWINSDQQEVDKYVNDPYCGTIFSNRYFYDMITGVEYNNRTENIANISKDLPIFFISGSLDPVGANTKGVKRVYNLYKDAGIKDIEIKFYPEARHEILNETNKLEVYDDISDWILNRM